MSNMIATVPTFPLARECPIDPPSWYADIREAGGPRLVRMFDGKPTWVFTRYNDVRAILGDNRFTTVPSTPNYPMLSEAREAVLGLPPTLIRMDPPEHSRLRRMLTREFMVKRINLMRPYILGIINERYDAIAAKGGQIDLMEDFALPVTSTVIAELLGVPKADHAFFQTQTRRRMMLDVGAEIPVRASKEVLAYFDKIVAEKEADPHAQDDLISRLIIEQVEPGHMTRDELVIHADFLTLAGHETTANQIGLGVLNFLENPDQKALLVADPTLVNGAVEEILRYNTIVQFNGPRVALEDIDVAGHVVKKGEAVFALIFAANRDPDVFACPHQFDITRNADAHVAFSFGVHQCLGQPLARAELQLVFSTIFGRFPNLRLAVPFSDLVFNKDHVVYGLKAVPVLL